MTRVIPILARMSATLPFAPSPPHVPRCFLPTDLDLGHWTEIAPWFDTLERRAASCQNAADFERWILDWGELSAALDEEGSKRYIAMTCHTDDPEAEKGYLHFVEQIEPELKPRQFTLSQLFLDHPLRNVLPQDRYRVFERSNRVQVELFRPENVPLETEESKLCQQYQKISGGLSVSFRGQEHTLVRMGRYLEEPDRATRQEAWELVAARRLQEAATFESLFDQLLGLRSRIARHAGFADYRSYAFRARGRFDYTPADCECFHQTVAEEFIPLLAELHQKRQRQMGLVQLRPWDLAADPWNRPPLKPFQQVEELTSKSQAIFDGLDSELGAGFRQMRDLQLLDLANRKGKAPGGYQSTLSESRLPFIFMNAIGVQRDVETLLHEAGHAFHTLATRDEHLHAYRSAPIEFCEVASMSMELLGQDRIEAFYTAPEAARSRRTHLEGIVSIFPWIAAVDAFQHWIYTHPNHSPSERASAWIDLMERFGGSVDWHGYETQRAALWHRQLHIFIHPFYYIEYGIAQLGALQVWSNSRLRPAEALAQYRRALALGGSRPLPDLFAAAGCAFDFSSKAVRPLVQLIRDELAKLPES